jgi:hypothetical protein
VPAWVGVDATHLPGEQSRTRFTTVVSCLRAKSCGLSSAISSRTVVTSVNADSTAHASARHTFESSGSRPPPASIAWTISMTMGRLHTSLRRGSGSSFMSCSRRHGSTARGTVAIRLLQRACLSLKFSSAIDDDEAIR